VTQDLVDLGDLREQRHVVLHVDHRLDEVRDPLGEVAEHVGERECGHEDQQVAVFLRVVGALTRRRRSLVEQSAAERAGHAQLRSRAQDQVGALAVELVGAGLPLDDRPGFDSDGRELVEADRARVRRQRSRWRWRGGRIRVGRRWRALWRRVLWRRGGVGVRVGVELASNVACH